MASIARDISKKHKSLKAKLGGFKIMSWTDDRVEALKKLWLEGHSASQIAKQLGGVTRNAVIGKVHRLGLSGRAAPSQPARPLYKPNRPARLSPAASPAATPTGLSKSPSSVLAAAMLSRRAEAQVMSAPSQALVPQDFVPMDETAGTATVLTLGAKMCKWPIGDPTSEAFSFCGRRSNDGIPYCAEHSRLAYQPSQKKRREGGQPVSPQRRYL
jgi:GcrA cell cycle regulator